MAGRYFGELDDRIALSPRKSATRITGFELRADGLMVPTYRRPQVRRIRLLGPLKGLALAAVVLLAFKVLIFAQAGPVGYDERLQRFGTEDAAARLVTTMMQADPVTVALGNGLRGLIHGDIAPTLEALALD
ncbi:MAG: hypothetical protein ACU0BS_06625 [Hasllibacter sp.]